MFMLQVFHLFTMLLSETLKIMLPLLQAVICSHAVTIMNITLRSNKSHNVALFTRSIFTTNSGVRRTNIYDIIVIEMFHTWSSVQDTNVTLVS